VEEEEHENKGERYFHIFLYFGGLSKYIRDVYIFIDRERENVEICIANRLRSGQARSQGLISGIGKKLNYKSSTRFWGPPASYVVDMWYCYLAVNAAGV
jgi:hypothetical protein